MAAETLALLWHVYKRLGLLSVRNALLRAYLPLAERIAGRLIRRLPQSVDLDELVSLGAMGLIDAIETFVPDRGTRFETYAGQRVRFAMIDGLRELDPADRKTRALLRRLDRVNDLIRVRHGRAPTSEELAESLALAPKQFRELEARQRALSGRSLCAGERGQADPAAVGPDRTPDPRAVDPARAASARILRETLVGHLAPQERLIVLLYHCEDLRMHEIGKVLGLSEARVSQLHAQIMRRLRARLMRRYDYPALACA